ncbi:DUF1640 domain-containing protein [Lamprobacter modestohalophilus]|jgi:hypothetical protein|uniref:DUF1640 domain-containing protein n=1 Tax=Lamprobacter modestohalophilus TaxID=1064514 RepID=UPI002ADEEE86|nr:DUF1640 domain-containing protein [Lamprobacter modestohalophilus]MEA1050387.1 DUF1640 domain-containing protein [Lamprobacter modestohalophilus]
MTSSVALYEALTNASDERSRARLIAEAFERLEERYPQLPDLATQADVRESELRLRHEIEQLRVDLAREIEQVRADLTRDIEQVRADLTRDIEKLRTEVERVKFELLKWLLPVMVGQVIAIAALVKLL